LTTGPGIISRGCWGQVSSSLGAVPAGIIANTGIVGVYILAFWSNIETSQGTYNWTNVQNVATSARNNGLKFRLLLYADLNHVPSYLVPAQTIALLVTTPVGDANYGNTVTVPVYWDSVYQARQIALYQAVEAQFGGQAGFQGLSVPFPCFRTPDVQIPQFAGTFKNVQTGQTIPNVDQPSQWDVAGYTTAQMKSGHKALVDGIAAALPGVSLVQHMHRGVKVTGTAPDLDAHYATLPAALTNYLLTAYPKQAYVQSDALGLKNTGNAPIPAAASLGFPGLDDNLGENWCYWIGKNNPGAFIWEFIEAVQGNESDITSGATTDTHTAMSLCLSLGLGYNPVAIELQPADSTNAALNDLYLAATAQMGGAHR
jgi:hypothetical protein